MTGDIYSLLESEGIPIKRLPGHGLQSSEMHLGDHGVMSDEDEEEARRRRRLIADEDAEDEDGETYMSAENEADEELGELLEVSAAAERAIAAFRAVLGRHLRQRRATGSAGGLYG